jgi:aminopeptidase N
MTVMRPLRVLASWVVILLVTALGAAPARASAANRGPAGGPPGHGHKYVAGSAGAGDPFFPLAGNGGYDVAHYSLRLRYQPDSAVLTGSATLRATATANLYRFDVDLRGFTITRLTVDGRAAGFTRDGQEVVITPRQRLRQGQRFTVTVDYTGVPEVVTDPDGSIEGWVPTDDGAFVVGEPQGSPGWYPANDDPRDKATFDFVVTVPDGLTAMANGVLVRRSSHGGLSSFWWSERYPMAPYLATATLGRFTLTESTVDGVPSYVAVDPAFTNTAVLDKIPSIVDFYASVYGRYPFDAVGAIVDNAPDVGYALETQTKPNFDRMPSEATLAHELAHQWYGDAVTLTTWPDIWLHEGFATWSEWIWSEHQGGRSAHDTFTRLYARPATDTRFWAPAVPAEPADLFSGPVYNRGAMTLQALREKVGDQAFFAILRGWFSMHRYGNATTADLIRLAERISGQDLRNFFDVWLYQPAKPTSW